MSLPYADKELGQHFLKDKNVITRITEDYKDQAKNIIEVGPGPAVLTSHLAELGLPLKVLEMDERFKEYLVPLLGEDNMIMGDALKADIDELLTEWKMDEAVWLVSNLPYNISTPLTMKFIQCSAIEFMTLMYQKEVGEKMVLREKKNTMGSLFAITNTFFECKRLMKVSSGAFHPPPKVDSIVISFKRLKDPVVALADFKKFERFLRAIFQFRRKQLAGILKAYKTDLPYKEIFEKLNIPSNTRAEALNLKQIHALFFEITNYGN